MFKKTFDNESLVQEAPQFHQLIHNNQVTTKQVISLAEDDFKPPSISTEYQGNSDNTQPNKMNKKYFNTGTDDETPVESTNTRNAKESGVSLFTEVEIAKDLISTTSSVSSSSSATNGESNKIPNIPTRSSLDELLDLDFNITSIEPNASANLPLDSIHISDPIQPLQALPQTQPVVYRNSQLNKQPSNRHIPIMNINDTNCISKDIFSLQIQQQNSSPSAKILNPVKTNELLAKTNTYQSILNEFDPFSDHNMFYKKPSPNTTANLTNITPRPFQNNILKAPIYPPLPSPLTLLSEPMQPQQPNYNITLPSSASINTMPGANNTYNPFTPTPFSSSISHPSLSSVFRPVQFNFGPSANAQHQLKVNQSKNSFPLQSRTENKQ